MFFEAKEKTGAVLEYSSAVPVSVVWDELDRIYNIRKNVSRVRVNLLPGKYFFEPSPKKVEKTNWLNKTPLFDLPPSEKKYESFSEDEIKVIRNEDLEYTPARTCVKRKRIEIGPRMDSMPFPFAYFILLHEIGHNMYFTEWKCDVFAFYVMMKKGFGISQCFYALDMVMGPGPKKDERVKKISNYIKKIKTYE